MSSSACWTAGKLDDSSSAHADLRLVPCLPARDQGAQDRREHSRASSANPSALVRALEAMEEELARRVLPAERSVMLRQVSKAMRAATESIKPWAMIKVKANQGIERMEEDVLDMNEWCRITSIDMSSTRIGAEGAERLAAVLRRCPCPSLVHLDLSDNIIEDEGVSRLASRLEQCPSLAHLNLCANWIGDDGMEGLAGVLHRCASLAHLDLSRNSIEDAGVARLAMQLQYGVCPSLAHLHLSSNGIGAEGAGRLAAGLSKCTSLAHLDLSRNRIGAEGVGRLAAGLGQCASLAHLNLSGNSIEVIGPSDLGDDGIGAEEMGILVAGLGRCPLLAYLDLSCNSIRDEGVKRLYAGLGQCASLTHLYLWDNDIQNRSLVREQHDNLNREITATQKPARQSVLLQY